MAAASVENPPHHTYWIQSVVFLSIFSKHRQWQISVLVLLDLSAAFDTVDRNILVTNTKTGWDSDTALNWFKSYLNDIDYFVSIGNNTSERMKMICVVPQASILGASGI